MMFAVARQIPFHHQRLCQGDATRGMGTSLFGKTLGIVGMGAIGRELALRARGLKMSVIASDPQPDRKFAADQSIELLPLDELLRRADFVSLHVRLSDDTHEMIGATELSLMKPTAYLVNTARQELVNEEALVDAILRGRIAGAGLDDPPGPTGRKLLGLPNVVFTPHLGNRAIEGVHGVFRTALEGAIAVIRGERPRFLLNPAVYDRGVRVTAPATLPASSRRPA
jgi:D-3-phosphoglycerate dehydrogenase